MKELPPYTARGAELAEFAQMLKSQPGEWHPYPGNDRLTRPEKAVDGVNSGRVRAFAGGGFRASCRQRVVYVCYVGERAATAQKATA